MSRLLKIFITLFTFTALASAADNIVFEEIDNDFELSVSTPEVKPKEKAAVKDLMHSKALELYKQNFDVELARDEEVVIVTIPSDDLFSPNETKLKKSASAILEKFKQFVTPAGKYKLLLVMHSDDTGSESYTFNLTDERVVAVMEFFERYNPADDAVKGYPRGDTEPLTDNNSRADRAQNRRLEIFIVPDTGLISEASQSSRWKK